MNLYAIRFVHIGPKSRRSGIETYLLADTDVQVRDWIDGTLNYNGWKTRHDELAQWDDFDPEVEEYTDEYGETAYGHPQAALDIYDEGYHVIARDASYLDRMLRLRGNAHDDSDESGDAFYGITRWYWDEPSEDVDSDTIATLIRMGIAQQATA